MIIAKTLTVNELDRFVTATLIASKSNGKNSKSLYSEEKVINGHICAMFTVKLNRTVKYEGASVADAVENYNALDIYKE